MVHVVCASATVGLLQSLMADKLGPEYSGEEFEVQVFITVSLNLSYFFFSRSPISIFWLFVQALSRSCLQSAQSL